MSNLTYKLPLHPHPRDGKPKLALLAMAVIACAIAAAGEGRADSVRHPNGVLIVDSRRPVFYHGQHYCWYDAGWRGAGWYVCGFGWRTGLGWGGGYGWHGWPGGLPPRHHHHPHHHHHHSPRGPHGTPGKPRP